MNKQELLDGLRELAAIKAEERLVPMWWIIDMLTLIESLPDPSKEPKDQNKEEDKQTPPRGGENQGGE
jgi:hypothetical protein